MRFHPFASKTVAATCLGAMFTLFMTSCGNSDNHAHHDHDHHDHGDHQHAGHAHVAPHGGTLVVFGDEFAHIELVIDTATGDAKLYILDGHAARGVRITQETISITILGSTESIVEFAAKANDLTGETVGDSSEFTAQSDLLKNQPTFKARIASITIKGKPFNNIEFPYPEGNE